MNAKKSLGQHFLRSRKALTQIVGAAAVERGETVLEIGPGEGVLTEALLASGAHVIAIEKDRDLIPLLTDKFAKEIDLKKLTLIEADILTIDPVLLCATLGVAHYKLVANIPYYITGAIIEKFLSTAHQPERMVILVQKEVAERIIARDKKMSIPAIAVSAYGTASIIATVPPGAFAPAPTVDSAILLIEGITRTFFADCDETGFFRILKAVFGKKRKQIGGSLSDFIDDTVLAHSILTQSAIDTKTRPENMTLQQWKTLTNAFTAQEKRVQ